MTREPQRGVTLIEITSLFTILGLGLGASFAIASEVTDQLETGMRQVTMLVLERYLSQDLPVWSALVVADGG